MTEKGQVTIPAEIRMRLGLKPKDSVSFELEWDVVRIRPVAPRYLASYGAVKPRSKPENWKSIREETERAIAQEVAAEG